MLQNTFVHIDGIGYSTERKLWTMGIRTWKDYMENWEGLDIPERKKNDILKGVENSVAALGENDWRFFRRILPKRDWWRAFSEFGHSTAYLDIETTGLSAKHSDITVIGIFDGKKVRTYIRGINLDDFQFELQEYIMMVTFNGAMFDIPFIEAKYPGIRFEQFHLDLRFLLKRLGYRGGLKGIEEELDIERSEDVRGVTGFDAVRLWREYQRGNDRALEKLIRYNAADVQNLKILMGIAYKGLKKEALTGCGAGIS